jgi:hypothetical protein
LVLPGGPSPSTASTSSAAGRTRFCTSCPNPTQPAAPRRASRPRSCWIG